MSYSSISSLANEFSTAELAKLSGDSSATAINEERINAFIAKADTVIDSFLGNCYSVPFVGAPPALIVSISADLAVYYLFQSAMAKTGVPAAILERKDSALEQLRWIAQGRMKLQGVSRRPEIPPPAEPPRRLFPANDLDTYS